MVIPTFTHDTPGTPAQEWQAHPSWGSVTPLELLNGSSPCTRLVVVAAHPDDESLGAGGLIATAHDRGVAPYLVLLSAGEASHPRSPTTTPQELAVRRLEEAKHALEVLAPGAPLVFLGVPDGGLEAVEEQITAGLVELVGDGSTTLLVAPWRHDGHPDHEAAGRAAAAAARRTGARLVEYPIWMWHARATSEAPWRDMCRFDLDEGAAGRKWLAIRRHTSQVEPLSDQPHDEVLLPPSVLAHFAGRVEHFVSEPVHDRALDAIQRDGADPWGVERRWYERRKRVLTTAVLPRERFARGLEVGCSRGALAQELAARCDELVAVDSSPSAVVTARARLEPLGVRVEQVDVPREWPEGSFDLVVVSEVGYFLSPQELDALMERINRCLTPDGVVLVCHWRHPVDGWVLDGPEVHERFRAGPLPPEVAHYQDPDVELSVLCGDWPDPRE
ncbi:MAG: PIG-L family deacetylase [Nocardioides sp.]